MTTTPDTDSDEETTATRRHLDVTVLLPCRNEEATVASCVANARSWIQQRGLAGEVLVIDNASTDHSAATALQAGARVVSETRIGYGHALRTGIRAARGTVIIMADADATYDLSNLDPFYDPLTTRGEPAMVIGDRFHIRPAADAMDTYHRLGNWALSALTRRLIGTPVRDVHCGLRSFTRDAMINLPTWSTGMEFATHTIAHAHHHNLAIHQAPVTLAPTLPGRHSHLRPIRDGIRHLAAIGRSAHLENGPRRKHRLP